MPSFSVLIVECGLVFLVWTLASVAWGMVRDPMPTPSRALRSAELGVAGVFACAALYLSRVILSIWQNAT